MAATLKFSSQQLRSFKDRIRNCLGDPQCRSVLDYYLNASKRQALLNVLQLWSLANSSGSFDESSMLDLIDEIDGFNDNPLLSLSEPEQKLEYVKSECCRILEPVHPTFIEYLNKHHRSCS